jgi:hypothetical protein
MGRRNVRKTSDAEKVFVMETIFSLDFFRNMSLV